MDSPWGLLIAFVVGSAIGLFTVWAVGTIR
jgi:hypothetical protein